MLFPLQFEITSFLGVLSLPFRGLLFTSWYPAYSYDIIVPAPEISSTSLGLNLIIGLVLVFPAILFNYRLRRRPVDKPIRRLAAAALVFSFLITFMAMYVAYALIGVSFYYSYMIFQNILAFPTIAVGAFIVLPVIQRQAVLIVSPKEMHSSTPEELQKNSQFGVGREVTLATVLWASLYFLPFLLFPYYISYYGQAFYASSLAYGAVLTFGGGAFVKAGLTSISGSVVPFFSLPMICILSSLRFVFVRDIYRHLKHEITYRRLLYLGFLADIFPVIAYIVMTGFLSSGYIFPYGILPVPLLAVVGMLVTRLHRSVLPLPNRIWEDVEARMWFEEEVKRQSVASVPEKSSVPKDEMITVPLTYMMVSHIRKRRHNNNSRTPDEA